MIDCEFTSQSRKIVERFLQSAVIVDDSAQLDKLIESREPVIAEELTAPPERPGIGGSKLSLEKKREPAKEEKDETGEEATNEKEEKNVFDAKQIINSFANKGIHCAVFIPKNQEDLDNLTSTIPKLAITSDILIFDWSLGDGGVNTRNFLKNLVHYDEDNRDRLRLIVIYTINEKILDILRNIANEIENIPNGPKVDINESEYSIQTGSTKIVALLKEAANVPQESPELLDREIPFNKLADRVIDEFAEMTHGLVPNVAIQSMSEIRKNTSKLLKRFNSELDAPYLTQRSLLENPEEAEEHLVALVAAELSALLEEKDVRASSNIQAIKQWIDYKKPVDEGFILDVDNGTPRNWSKEQVIKLLEKGINVVSNDRYGIGKDRFITNALNSNLTKMYHCSDVNQQYLDDKFAVVTIIRGFYGKPTPRLNLGTIIKTIDDTNQYYICIQPRCDCVRITDKRNFLFLPLTLPEGYNFDLTVEDNGTFLRFSIKKSSYDIKPIEFVPNSRGKGCVVTYMREEGYCLRDARKKIYKWIGELRVEHALSLSNEFSSELSRVGPNESEWLRRKKPKRS